MGDIEHFELDEYAESLIEIIKADELQIVQAHLSGRCSGGDIKKALQDKFEASNSGQSLNHDDTAIILRLVKSGDLTSNSIRNIHYSKFRTLSDFIKGRRKGDPIRTSDFNLDILALLLDFEPRPFRVFKHKYKLTIQTVEQISIKESELNNKKAVALYYLIKFFERAKDEFQDEESIRYFFADFITPLSQKAILRTNNATLSHVLVSFTEEKIQELNKKLVNINNANSIFGRFGLLFITVPSIETVKGNLYDQFCEELQALGMDNLDFDDDDQDDAGEDDDDDPDF